MGAVFLPGQSSEDRSPREMRSNENTMRRTAPVFHPWPFLRGGVFLCLLPLLFSAGCQPAQDAVTNANNHAALPGNGPADAYRVRALAASFFRVSPLQPSGPDEQLKKDTEVTMIKASRTYSRVKTPNGETGYVATEDISPLTSGELAMANNVVNNSPEQARLEAQRQAAARSMGGNGYTIPPEAGNQERLPEPDARPAGSKVNAGAAASPTPNPIFHP